MFSRLQMLLHKVEHLHSSSCPDQVQCWLHFMISIPIAVHPSCLSHISRFEECLYSGEVSYAHTSLQKLFFDHPSFFSIEGIHRILVATSDGTLYMGNIDPRDGGECRITKEFRLFVGPGDPPPDEEERAPNVSPSPHLDTVHSPV